LIFETGHYLTEATTSNIQVQAIIHDIVNGVGPSYFPPAEYHNSLPETDLKLQCHLPKDHMSDKQYIVTTKFVAGKYSSERAAREWSTVVDISIHPPSFKLVSLSSPRSPLSKTPKHVIF